MTTLTTTPRRILVLLLVTVALLLCHGTASAQLDSVLGDQGVLYSVQAGTYGDLFPEGNAAAEDHVVLRLLIDRGDQGVEHHLVPGTEDDAVEVNPSLLAENGAGDVYLLWGSWRRLLHSSIHLTNLSEDGWATPIEITGTPFVLKSSPRLLLTRDEVAIPDDAGHRVLQQRTILHLAWVENGATAEERIIYSPLLLIDGRHVASGQTLVLNDLVPPLDPEQQPAPGYAFDEALLSLRSGENPHSIVIVFSDRASQRLVSLDMRVLSGEISFLADRLFELVADQPATVTATADGLLSLADQAKRAVEETDTSLQPVLRSELADQIHGFLATHEPGIAPRELAGESRDRFLDEGANLTEPGNIQNITGRRRPHWVDFGYRGPRPGGPGGSGAEESVRTYQVVSRVAAERPAPESTLQDDVELIVSSDGEALALVWQVGDDLFYQESDAETGWHQTNRLRLSDEMAEETARLLVQNHVDKM